MCISKLSEETCKNMNRSSLGRAVRGVLAQAKIERRLICGLYQAIVYLEENAEDALLCLLPESRPGDVTAHMQTVLLQAFCYENCIPVITVDNSQRLATLCGITSKAKEGGSCACAVVTRDPNIPWDENGDPPLSPGEKTLQDFYECTIEEFPKPVVQLPV